jgi:hypothetical protein
MKACGKWSAATWPTTACVRRLPCSRCWLGRRSARHAPARRFLWRLGHAQSGRADQGRAGDKALGGRFCIEAAAIMGFPNSVGRSSHYGWHIAPLPPPKPQHQSRSIGLRICLTTTAPSCRAGRSRSGSTRRCPISRRAEMPSSRISRCSRKPQAVFHGSGDGRRVGRPDPLRRLVWPPPDVGRW